MAGFFYVSAQDGPRRALIRGPFSTHQEALDKVQETMDEADKLDCRAFFWAWGTARSDVDLGPGSLDRLKNGQTSSKRNDKQKS